MLTAKAGQEEVLKQELLALIEPTRKEAGCVRYVLHQTEEGNKFLFHEIWTSVPVWKQHMETPHLLAFLPKAPGLLEGDLELGQWTRIEAPMPENTPMDAIVLTVVVKVKPDKAAEAKAAMQALLAPTLKEDGCILYDMNCSNDNDTTFLFYEIWENAEKLGAHGQSAHMKAYMAVSGELVDDVVFTRWQLVK